MSHHPCDDCLVTAVVTVTCAQTIVNTRQTQINSRNQTCSSNAARGVSNLRMTPPFVVLVHPRTVEVPRLLGWPHHARALANTRQRAVCHCNGRKQTRSRRVWSASEVRRGCLRHLCHVVQPSRPRHSEAITVAAVTRSFYASCVYVSHA